MISFLAARISSALVVVLGVACLVFLLIHLVPGDPVEVMRGLAVPDAECPARPRGRDQRRGPGPSVDLLKVLVKLKAEAACIAHRLIANSDDIEAISLDDGADVPALKGWRRELFGEDALALKHGRLALTSNGRKSRVSRINGQYAGA